MTRALTFGRIALWLWAGSLIVAQSQEIGQLRHGQEFWSEVAYSTARTCAQAITGIKEK